MKNQHDRILDDIKSDTDKIQIPDSLLPDNMMARIAKKKQEGYFLEEAKKDKNSDKKFNKKLATWITGSATIVAAASLGLVLMGTDIGNKNAEDKMIYKNFYSGVAENDFAGNKVSTLSSFDDLVDYYYTKNTFQYTDMGMSGIKGENSVDDAFGDIYPEDEGFDTNETPSVDSEANEPDYSDTNVRTENVAEADIVKTDGEYIYYLRYNYRESNDVILKIVKAEGAYSAEVCEISLMEDMNDSLSGDKEIVCGKKEIMLYEDKLAVVCTDNKRTAVVFYDISDKTNPELINTLFIDGQYDSCRLVDGHLYVFTERSIANELTNYNWKSESTRDKIIDEITPQTSNGEVSADEIYVSNCENFNYYHMIGAVNMNETAKFEQVKAVLGQNGGVLYVSANNIYYIDNVYENYSDNNPGDEVEMVTKSEIIRLAYKNGKIEGTGRALVEGVVGDTFAIDEYNGYLRIAVSANKWKGTCELVDVKYYDGKNWIEEEIIQVISKDYSAYKEVSALYVLDDELQVVGSIPDLKEDEKVYGVRFDGDIAYVVTYRVMDPLFTIDLSNPAEPKVIGELKIPGFSTYLHKWGEDKLIGIGLEDGWQVKISTFDISDKTDVRETDVCILDGVFATEALYNHKAVFVSPEKNLIGFMVQGRIYKVFSYVDDTLTEVIDCYMYSDTSEEARGLYIDDYIYIVGQDSGVFVYSMDDYSYVTEVN